MMRKVINYFVFVVVLLVLPFVVNAASATVGMSCPSSAKVGDTVSCNVTVSSDVKVNGIVVNYSFTGASYVSFTPSSGFTSNYASASGFNIGNNSGKSGSYTVGVLKVKVNNVATVVLKNIDISDVNFNSYSSANRSVNIRLKSTNNSLASLSLSNGTLSPSFNANTTSYTSTIDSSNVTINYSKGDSTQTVTGAGKKTLKYGKNTFKVVVKSEAGTTKTYTIVINRPDNRSSNNNLKTLSVDKGSIAFKSSTTSYSLKVANDVESIKVSATLDDSKASFVNGYGPRTVKLNYGSNSVLVKVKAENEAIKTYTIKVERQDNRSGNNNLKSLSLSAGTIAFSKDVTTYNTTVDYSVTKIDIIAEVEDVKSKYVVNSPSLFVGNNVITVTVTAENGSTKVYTINVVRKEEAAILSDNNNVSSIDILGHGIKFEDGVTEYDVEIGDEYALVIEVLLEDPSANYVIEGNEDLKDGSVIKVTTTSESGQQKEYRINVNKKIEATENKGDKSLLFGIVGFVLGVVTMLAITFILNRAKKSKIKAGS